MSPSTRLDIDLAFSIVEPISESSSPSDSTESRVEQMSGTVTASGLDIEIYSNNPELFVRTGTIRLKDIRGIAAELADRGLVMSLAGPNGMIVRMGAVKASVGQRILTGSSNIALGSRNALAPLLRRRRAGATATPSIVLPPSTLFPLVPTFDRRIRRKITTTHYTPGSGRPRLIFVVGSENWNGQKPREFDLGPGTTTIGSSTSADLQLPGLEAIHAEIRHDGDDEYVLYAIGEVGGGSRPFPGEDEGGRILRTGARMEMGQWRMGFFREEYADHGRPFGGRVGGELAFQKPQPARHRAENATHRPTALETPEPLPADDSEI